MGIAAREEARSKEWRSVLPSIATTSLWVFSVTDWIHEIKHLEKASGFKAANVRPKVSCEGMPWGNARNVRNHLSLAFPNASIATQLSAPQITPQIAITIMSCRACSFPRWIRGSGSVAKCSEIDAEPLVDSFTLASIAGAIREANRS